MDSTRALVVSLLQARKMGWRGARWRLHPRCLTEKPHSRCSCCNPKLSTEPKHKSCMAATAGPQKGKEVAATLGLPDGVRACCHHHCASPTQELQPVINIPEVAQPFSQLSAR
jgi:hypothetical protein